MNKNFSLNKKVALITGSSSGIGAEIAKEFSKAGAKVYLIARNEKKLKALTIKLNKKYNTNNKFIVCNINNYEEFKRKILKIKNIDIYVNNAGMNIPKHFFNIKISELDEIINLNMKSMFVTTQIIVRKMIKMKNYKKKNLNIINISSTLGHVGSLNRTAYSMTKFGVEGFTKSLAVDLANYNIRVNAIAPTAILTPMLKKYLTKDFRKKTISNILMKRIGSVDDVASTEVFLASNAAKFITGTSILVDVGWKAK